MLNEDYRDMLHALSDEKVKFIQDKVDDVVSELIWQEDEFSRSRRWRWLGG